MIQCPKLGRLERVRIGHDNSGFGAGWFLDKVRGMNVACLPLLTFLSYLSVYCFVETWPFFVSLPWKLLSSLELPDCLITNGQDYSNFWPHNFYLKKDFNLFENDE